MHSKGALARKVPAAEYWVVETRLPRWRHGYLFMTRKEVGHRSWHDPLTLGSKALLGLRHDVNDDGGWLCAALAGGLESAGRMGQHAEAAEGLQEVLGQQMHERVS